MREIRSSGSVEGVVGNHDSYSDRFDCMSAGLSRSRRWLAAALGLNRSECGVGRAARNAREGAVRCILIMACLHSCRPSATERVASARPEGGAGDCRVTAWHFAGAPTTV
jgi:hypothetical protein